MTKYDFYFVIPNGVRNLHTTLEQQIVIFFHPTSSSRFHRHGEHRELAERRTIAGEESPQYPRNDKKRLIL